MFKLKTIESLEEAMEVRKIRNECCEFMTSNQNKISILQQVAWYSDYNKKLKDKVACFLVKDDDKNVGYALIRVKSSRYWLTGGLIETARGKGLGTLLFETLMSQVPPNESIWLEVLETNVNARKLYEKLGFQMFDQREQNGQKVLMMCVWPKGTIE